MSTLLRVLGLGFGLAVIVGNTIGAGILRTPGEVAAHLPHPALLLGVWILGGLYALLGALSIAELATTVPRSGGQYVFARRALGDYAGFIVGWSDWVSTCGSTAAVAIVVGEYAVGLTSPLAGRPVAMAVAAALVLALLQWRGIRWGSGIQNLTSLLKAVGFLGLIGACLLVTPSAGGAGRAAAIAPGASGLLAVILALQAVIYTYDGWTGVIYFSEEVRDPARDVPRALFSGVWLVMGIYLLVNLALLRVVPLERLAGHPMPVGLAADAAFGPRGDTVVRVLVIVSMLAAINAFHLMATRVLFAMSRDGLVSRRLADVNDGGTPGPALLVSAAVAVAFILTGTFTRVIAVVSFFFVFNYALSFLSLLVLRRLEPDLPRPYRVPWWPWPTLLSLLGSLAFLGGAVAVDPANSLWALVVLGLSWPLFRAMTGESRPRATKVATKSTKSRRSWGKPVE